MTDSSNRGAVARAHAAEIQPSWQPLGIDIGRRQALMGLSSLVMAALSSARARAAASLESMAQNELRTCVLTPEAGEGPFYLDPKLIRSDIRSGQPGAPLNLALQVVRAGDCATLTNARVDVWHADALGLYSGYERQSGVGGISTQSAIGQQYLRGTQMTDGAGSVQFRTIFPSWYGGRTPHVHFKVFLGGNEVVASQIFFPDEISKDIFSSVEPYRQHASKRSTFNSNDPIKQGVYSQVTRQSGVYAARAVLVVAAT
jgi:protocatechuate 3,4-dioxygenase beta subunit